MKLLKAMAIGTALTLTASSYAAAEGQTSNKHQLLSSTLVVEAEKAFGSQDIDGAQLLYERALVANPANVSALIGLGKTFEEKGQTGKGLTYYRYALEIEPNDQLALKAQSLAFLKRDLYDRAEENRDRLRQLCSNGCAALTTVQDALTTYLKDEEESQKVAAAGTNNGGR